jgi:hypothetical protein
MTNKTPLESITLFPHTFTTWATAELAVFLAIAHEPPAGTCLHFAVRWTDGAVYTGDIPLCLDEAGGISSRPLASHVRRSLEHFTGRRPGGRLRDEAARRRAALLLDQHEIEGGESALEALDLADTWQDLAPQPGVES